MEIKFTKENIDGIALKILDKVSKKNCKENVITLSGDLGAGKTTLTKSIGKLLHIKNNIISPTFVIMKIYKVGNNSIYYKKFKKMIHIDAYRFSSKEELSVLNLESLIQDKENLVIIEWPEMINGGIKNDVLSIKLEHVNEETRTIKF